MVTRCIVILSEIAFPRAYHPQRFAAQIRRVALLAGRRNEFGKNQGVMIGASSMH
jgi:hypothetical protein